MEASGAFPARRKWVSTDDGKLLESVYMPSSDRRTLCVSTQVGCAMGCKFCATATLGLLRNLAPSEIVAQVHAVNAEVRRNEGLDGWYDADADDYQICRNHFTVRQAHTGYMINAFNCGYRFAQPNIDIV